MFQRLAAVLGLAFATHTVHLIPWGPIPAACGDVKNIFLVGTPSACGGVVHYAWLEFLLRLTIISRFHSIDAPCAPACNREVQKDKTVEYGRLALV